MNHSRRGHLGWMRWSGAKKTRMPGPPTRLLPAPSRSLPRKSSRRGRFISNLRHAARLLCSVGAVKILLRGWPCLAVLSVQVMMEQNVQTFITWTHGVQPTWLQYHGPSLHDRLSGVQVERPLCPHYGLQPLHPPEDNPARLLWLRHTRRSTRSADQLSADDLRSLTRTPKRTRTLKATASTSAEHYSRRPFTVFTPKRAARSRTTRCKHYCHAFLHHGRKCLSPCVRRQPGHFHCRCARHQRR